MAEHPKDFALTLARGLAVLECFSPDQVTLTTSEAAAQVGISRAAARRLLLTLVTLGYLDHDGQRYKLTDRILSIGQGVLARDGRWQRVAPDVIELANTVNEPVSISVLDKLDIVFVVRDQKRRIFSARLFVGDRLPAHCSSAGKVLLAALEYKELRRRVDAHGPLRANTERSITQLDALEQELKRIRIEGWASAEDEMELGTISIAMPLFDGDYKVVAALALSSHKMRRSMQELRDSFLPALQNVANRISDKLAVV